MPIQNRHIRRRQELALPVFVQPTEIPANAPQIAPKVYISSSTDYVRFFEKRTERTVDDDVPAQVLKQLTHKDLAVKDSNQAGSEAGQATRQMKESEDIIVQGAFSPFYEALLHALEISLARDETGRLFIPGAEVRLKKAAGLRNRMVSEEAAPAERISFSVPESQYAPLQPAIAIVPRESRISLEPAHMRLQVTGSYGQEAVRSWERHIKDEDEDPVKSIQGEEGCWINWHGIGRKKKDAWSSPASTAIGSNGWMRGGVRTSPTNASCTLKKSYGRSSYRSRATSRRFAERPTL
jgi:hypothetical protein